jgi:PAS domain S-box-containing protein
MSGTSHSNAPRSPSDVLENIPVIAFDKQWRYTRVSRRAAEILGKAPVEMIGQSMRDLFPNEIDTEFQQACERAWKEGKPVTVER